MEINSYRIRKAVESDSEVIVKMILDFHADFPTLGKAEMTVKELPVTEFQKDGFGNAPLFYCHVAETKLGEPVIVGYTLYYFIYSTWKGKSITLEDLYVEKQYRGQGIGTELIKATAKVAVETGCSQCRIDCLESNSPALNLYKHLGAKDMTVTTGWHTLYCEKTELSSLAHALKNWEEM